jgi:tellurite resistance protein TerC
MTTMTLRQGRRIVVTVIGGTLMLMGAAMLVLPGPGVLVIAGGLAVLATEFVWARRWLKKIKQSSTDMANAVMGTSGNKKVP